MPRCIATSATMALGGTFDTIARSLGLSPVGDPIGATAIEPSSTPWQL